MGFSDSDLDAAAASLASRLDHLLVRIPNTDRSHVCKVNNGPRHGLSCTQCRTERYSRKRAQ